MFPAPNVNEYLGVRWVRPAVPDAGWGRASSTVARGVTNLPFAPLGLDTRRKPPCRVRTARGVLGRLLMIVQRPAEQLGKGTVNDR